MGLEGRWTDRRTETPRVTGISDLLFNTHFQSDLTASLLEGSCFPACRISSETLPGWLLTSGPRIFSRRRRFFRVCADPGRRAVAAGCGGCCCDLLRPARGGGCWPDRVSCLLCIAGVQCPSGLHWGSPALSHPLGGVLGSRGRLCLSQLPHPARFLNLAHELGRWLRTLCAQLFLRVCVHVYSSLLSKVLTHGPLPPAPSMYGDVS